MCILWVCDQYDGPCVQTHIHKREDIVIDGQYSVTETNNNEQFYIKFFVFSKLSS